MLAGLVTPPLASSTAYAVAQSQYAITSDPDGRILFLTRAIDENGHARESYSDHKGLVRAFVEHPSASSSSL